MPKYQKNDIEVELEGELLKVQTWDWLFEIRSQYRDALKSEIPSMLRLLSTKYMRQRQNYGKSYLEIIDELKLDREINPFQNAGFLQIAILEEIKNREDIIEVYD